MYSMEKCRIFLTRKTSKIIPILNAMDTKRHFNKYAKFGSYHWSEYKNKDSIYSKHADEVKSWIRPGKTLDIGAGDGLITSLIRAIGIDDNALACKLAEKHGVIVEYGSAYEVPFKDESFDNVFMGDVIEHLERPEESLKEVRRVLKKDGLFYVTTTPKEESIGDPHHFQEWTLPDFKNFLKFNGFKVVGKPYIKNVRMYVVCKKQNTRS